MPTYPPGVNDESDEASSDEEMNCSLPGMKIDVTYDADYVTWLVKFSLSTTTIRSLPTI